MKSADPSRILLKQVLDDLGRYRDTCRQSREGDKTALQRIREIEGAIQVRLAIIRGLRKAEEEHE